MDYTVVAACVHASREAQRACRHANRAQKNSTYDPVTKGGAATPTCLCELIKASTVQ